VRVRSILTLLDEAHTRHAGQTLHVGVLVPWANTVVETELPRLGLTNVVFHYARLVPQACTTALDENFLRGLEAAVPDALAQVARLPLASVIMACTSAGFTATQRYPAGVVSAYDALLAALEQLQAERIVLATPYPHELTSREADAFRGAGIDVVASTSLGRADDLAAVTTYDTHDLLDHVDPAAFAAADALVLSCTAWPTLPLIAELEDTLGLPVVSSNLAMALYPFLPINVEEGA
jgi:maleate isomerase